MLYGVSLWHKARGESGRGSLMAFSTEARAASSKHRAEVLRGEDAIRRGASVEWDGHTLAVVTVDGETVYRRDTSQSGSLPKIAARMIQAVQLREQGDLPPGREKSRWETDPRVTSHGSFFVVTQPDGSLLRVDRSDGHRDLYAVLDALDAGKAKRK
jgi:hypothetical protein